MVWLVQGGVGDYVMKEAWASIFRIKYGQDVVKKGQLRKPAKRADGCFCLGIFAMVAMIPA